MITPAKLTFFSTLYLTVFALIPGLTADFLLVPERARPDTLAACALFLAGFLFGAKLASYNLYPSPVARQVPASSVPVSQLGIVLLGAAMLLMTAYIVQFGPKPPILAAAAGSDLYEAALLREEAVKLNADTSFVKAYSYTRDLLAPAAFTMALIAFRQAGSGVMIRVLCILMLCAAGFIGVWSGQKATVLNYIVAATIFMARDTAALTRFLVIWAPAFTAAIFIMFLVAYPDTFENTNTFEVVSNVWEGLLHRMFISPFEVSMAYIDAIDYQKFIYWLDTIPIFGAMLRPGVPSVENVIGTHYFYSGIDSISANGLCFAYTYIQGGLPLCLLVGWLTSVTLILSLKFVRTGGNEFINKAFQAVVMYKVLDLLNGNPLSYLIGVVQIAILAWILARFCAGFSGVRLSGPAKRAT